MRISLLLLLFTNLLLLICFPSFSQNKTQDSIVAILDKISGPLKRTREANAISRKSWKSGNYELGIIAANEAIELATEYKFPAEEAKAYKYLGIIYDYKGEYVASTKYYFKALPIFERLGHKQGQSDVYSNIGLLNYHQTNFRTALAYHGKALKIRKEINNKRGISGSYNNIGIVYSDLGQYTPALQNMLESVRIDRELNDERGLGDSYNNVGLIYMNLKDYKRAEIYYRESERIYTKYGNSLGLSLIALNLASMSYDLKDYEKSEQQISNGLYHSKKIGARSPSMHLYDMLRKVHEAKGDYKNALSDQKNVMLYLDSLSSEDITRKQTQTEMQYGFDKESLIRKKEQEKLRIGIFAAAILAGMLLFFAIIIFRRLRITRNQKREIEFKNQLVEEKNREILDSITYAKRIQNAILPPDKLVKSFLKDSFILYKPKDIVAGDFYWMEHIGNKLIFAAADCTGHGVPGALVSVVCHNALNRSVREFGFTEPGSILDKTREIVLEEFAKSEDEVNDGMDISLCTLDLDTLQLQWSGANNPLWIVRHQNDSIDELKPSKQPIGRYSKYSAFETHLVQLEKDDGLYLFTDGFADQFGGPDGKKLKASRMKELILHLREKSMPEQLKVFESEFTSWKNDADQVDDVCVIGIRI